MTIDDADDGPSHIGQYKLVELLGEGDSSEVYRAREPLSGREVALKILKRNHADRPGAVQRFRDAAETTVRLEHRNIVRVYDTTQLHAVPPFYTMQLVAGGTLARSRREAGWTVDEASELMIKVADAIHFAHEEGVLHRNLRPSSVLVGFDGEPYVTGFGRRQPDDPLADVPEEAVPYLSPERAAGEPARKCADVYGLGAIFCELLTGRPPAAARTAIELLSRDRARRPAQWQSALSRMAPTLSDVCQAALAEDPLQRTPTAHLFGDGLRRALNHEPPLFPPVSRLRRLRLWTLRHPVLALCAAAGLALLVVADTAMFVVARVEHAEAGRDILRTNAALAKAQARGVLAGLKRYADYTLEAAAQPAVLEAILHPTTEPAPALRDIYERAGMLSPATVFTVDSNGVLVSIWPVPIANLGRSYGFRDYFECTKALALRNGRSVCISPAYRSETNDGIQFAFSSPVYDAAGKWVGTLVLTRLAARTLGEIDFNDRYRSSQLTAVIGGRGPDRRRSANREEMIVVVHPDLHGSTEFPLEPSLAKRLVTSFGLKAGGGHIDRNDAIPVEYDRYVDPVPSVQERMLASFAPVGQTGYVVAVATPFESAQRPNQRLLNMLFTYGSVLNLCCVLVAAIAVWASSRESRPFRSGTPG